MVAEKNLRFQGKSRELAQQIERRMEPEGYKTQSTKAPLGNVIQAQKAGRDTPRRGLRGQGSHGHDSRTAGRLVDPHRHRQVGAEPRGRRRRDAPPVRALPGGRHPGDALDDAPIIRADQSLFTAARLMDGRNCNALLVEEKGRIVGVITRRGIERAYLKWLQFHLR